MRTILPRALSLPALLALAGCLTHVAPDPNLRHLDIGWARDFATARARAAESDQPILLVLVAGEIHERCWIGGALLRDGALSDPEVIDLVNRRFIPVWINIRTTPVPDIPCLDEALPGVHLDEQRYVGFLGQGFFLRSIVLSPQGTRLLNPEWGGSSLLKLVVDGHFAYAAVKPPDYLQMLEKALSRLDPD